MKNLTIYAHPDPQSFCAAVRDRFLAGLREAGHQVELADLYAERFNPVFRYPGITNVEHEYFWAVPSVDAATRQQYLARAQELGRDFAHGCGENP